MIKYIKKCVTEMHVYILKWTFDLGQGQVSIKERC